MLPSAAWMSKGDLSYHEYFMLSIKNHFNGPHILTADFIILDILQMFHRHLENISFLQFGLLLRDNTRQVLNSASIVNLAEEKDTCGGTHIKLKRSDHSFF